MWQKTDNNLYQKLEFKNFDEAFSFVEKVAEVARQLNHHPKITNNYNVVELWLSTHSAGDMVTKKDEEFAQKIDQLFATKKPAKNEQFEQAKLFTDGGSRGNPGPSATGYVLLDMEDNVVKKEGKYLGITTNNQAEYLALKSGMEAAREYGVEELEVYMDSLLVVNQMKGIYKVKSLELQPIHQSVKELAGVFRQISFTYVPRELNKLADGMVNECLDAQK